MERSDSLHDNLMAGTWANESEPLTTFLMDNGDTGALIRRGSMRGPTYTPHHPSHPGHIGPMTHELIVSVPRTVDSTVRALTHDQTSAATREANRRFQDTLKEND